MNKSERLRSWTRRLQAIADEMELEGYETNAEHLDFIISDCEFEELAFNGGARVTFKDTAFIGKDI